MNFHSLYDQGFTRVAAVTLPVHPAQPLANAEEIIAAARSCDERGVSIALFPELCVSGYAIFSFKMFFLMRSNTHSPPSLLPVRIFFP